MPTAIIVHGGAGPVRPDYDPEPRLEGCRRAALAGWEVLRGGGSALDAAEAAVVVLEDDPLFNAGTGSVLGRDGTVEMDASIMDGSDARSGAVGAVRGVRNPIRLARRLLEDGRHVLLVAEGARAYAREAGVAECEESALVTERQRRRWEDKHGTVGAVALDAAGRLAAATSTGGMLDKLPGRVGDTALIGAGTYAEPAGAASCTGIGETIIRAVLAKTAVDRLREGRESSEAAQGAIRWLVERTGGEAGIILIDSTGRIGYAHNAKRMALAAVNPDGQIYSEA